MATLEHTWDTYAGRGNWSVISLLLSVVSRDKNSRENTADSSSYPVVAAQCVHGRVANGIRRIMSVPGLRRPITIYYIGHTMRRDIDRVRSPNVTSEPFAEVEGDRVDLCGTDIYFIFFLVFRRNSKANPGSRKYRR